MTFARPLTWPQWILWVLAEEPWRIDPRRDAPAAPPIAGGADPERETRLDAERATLEFGSRSTKKLDGGQLPIEESPLFGGRAQAGLFGGGE